MVAGGLRVGDGLEPRHKVHHPKRRKHSKHQPPAFGTVSLIAKCSQGGRVSLGGVVTELLGKNPRHGQAGTRVVHLATVRAGLEANVATTMQLRLGPSLLGAMEHGIRESGAFTLSAGGSTRARASARLQL